MYRKSLYLIVFALLLASCHTPAWIQFKNKTKSAINMRYGYEGDSVMDVVIPPKSRVLLVYNDKDKWEDDVFDNFFEKDIHLEFYNETDTVVYADKKKIYDLFKKGRNHNRKGITIKIKY